MDRLTWRDAIGQALLAPEFNDKYDALELIDILLDRLAAYEDTGLTPEEIMADMPDTTAIEAALDRYQCAEAEGRLVVLPCKVGGIRCIGTVI